MKHLLPLGIETGLAYKRHSFVRQGGDFWVALLNADKLIGRHVGKYLAVVAPGPGDLQTINFCGSADSNLRHQRRSPKATAGVHIPIDRPHFSFVS